MPFQREFIESPARFLCLMAGRGAGKTHAIQARSKILCTRHPKFRYMYVTPLSVQGDEIFEQMLADKSFYKFVKRPRARPYPRIIMKNGSRIWFRSFQRPDGLRSTGENEICIDESQDASITESDVENVLSPIVSRVISYDGNRGRLVLSGQFRGDDWRKKKYFDPGQEFILDENTGEPTRERNTLCRRPLFASWRIPTSAGFRYQGESGRLELELQKSNCTQSAWEQEWLCLPRANKNAVYSPSMIDAISTKRILIEGQKPVECWSMDRRWTGEPTVTAVDIGEIEDYSAVCVINSQGHVVYSEKFPKQYHAISAVMAAKVASHFGSRVMLIDATGGGKPGQSAETYSDILKLYRDAAHERGVDFEPIFFMNQKKRMIVNLEVGMQENQIVIPAKGCEGLLAEMKAYEYTYNEKSKWYNYSAPKGQHDDRLSALLMAWDGFKRGLASNSKRYSGGY